MPVQNANGLTGDDELQQGHLRGIGVGVVPLALRLRIVLIGHARSLGTGALQRSAGQVNLARPQILMRLDDREGNALDQRIVVLLVEGSSQRRVRRIVPIAAGRRVRVRRCGKSVKQIR